MCAECEVALLQLHDFEELITYLKVGNSLVLLVCRARHPATFHSK